MSHIRQNIIILIILIMHGCSYLPIIGFDSIEFNQNNTTPDSKDPLIFHRECNKTGSAWLYECQFMGLISIYDAIVLQNTTIDKIHNIHMHFYPKYSYIIYHIYDNSLKDQ